MKLGSVFINNRILDLDVINKEELEELYNTNNKDKEKEYNNAKKICQRQTSDELDLEPQNISLLFKNFLDTSTNLVKNEALLNSSIVAKNSNDTINEKVNNKIKSIEYSIKRINPKFVNDKKYGEVQENLNKSMAKYEDVLDELAEFFDTKIEQLILKKVELESHLIGRIISDEYYIEEEVRRTEEKDNNKLLLSLSSSVQNFVTKLTKKKEDKTIDVTMIEHYQDKAELEAEQKDILKNMIVETQNSKIENKKKISEIENEILTIETEIRRINKNKIKTIMEAMESGTKEISTIVRNNSGVFTRFKNFFKSKFNPSSVIYETILDPFKDYIYSYEENVLSNLKK